MRTKEEILAKHSTHNSSNIFRAMDEYAKQVAIDFAEFVNSYTLQSLNDNDNWYYEKTYKKYQTVSDEQLFQEYLNNIR